VVGYYTLFSAFALLYHIGLSKSSNLTTCSNRHLLDKKNCHDISKKGRLFHLAFFTFVVFENVVLIAGIMIALVLATAIQNLNVTLISTLHIHENVKVCKYLDLQNYGKSYILVIK